MITEKDLEEAIAECQGQRNPNANTCIKLAAFYTIRDQLFRKTEQPRVVHSYATPPHTKPIAYTSDTEFSDVISGMDVMDVLAVMDELMTTLEVLNPRLYNSVIRKLNND